MMNLKGKLLTKSALLAVLDDLRSHVGADDSFEGSLEYSLPGEDAPEGFDGFEGFEVRAAYRVGNSMGQGSVRMVGQLVEDDPGAPEAVWVIMGKYFSYDGCARTPSLHEVPEHSYGFFLSEDAARGYITENDLDSPASLYASERKRREANHARSMDAYRTRMREYEVLSGAGLAATKPTEPAPVDFPEPTEANVQAYLRSSGDVWFEPVKIERGSRRC